MEILYLLIPLAVVLAGGVVVGVLLVGEKRPVRRPRGPAHRILMDEKRSAADTPAEEEKDKNSHSGHCHRHNTSWEDTRMEPSDASTLL